MSAAEDILSGLVDLIAERVAERLQTRATPAVYTSLALPPGCRTREAFNDRCRNIAEAYQDGKVWVCPVDAYEAAVRRGGVSRQRAERRPRIDARAILRAGTRK